ncbi:MAG: rhombosortase [Candidatus Thiodiazotropha lotti]|nr:rhombosortase [Candidatus Thiodiazotropha lotti]MCG7998436.1 rhombosortase [Candidatus Thiodiazotropha lotti]MCW4183590.1 rhombosortase [Candidatus Thiodiazotropha weberae]MCW4190202.1 rhombosortase [Candidatus Thiodiazotropha weberae]
MDRSASFKFPFTHTICPLAVTLVCLLLSVATESASGWFEYHRDHISNGEIWRLITAHLVHLGWGHLTMNLLGLWMIWALLMNNLPSQHCGLILLFITLITSAALWYFSPQLVWYRGLSGALHGLLIWGLFNRLKIEPLLSVSLLLAVTGKIAWEQWQGPLPGSESMADGPVVVASHLYGALSGMLVWLIGRILFAINRKTSE